MSQHPHDANGFPEIEREPVPMPELGDYPTPIELARAYGSVVVGWYRQWGRLVDAVYWLRGAVMGAKAEAEAARKAVEGAPQLPPMRSPMGSTNDLAKAVGHDVAQAFERDQRNPSTPPPNGATVGEMVRERVEHELLKVKAATLQREADERRALELAAREAEAALAVEKRRGRVKVVFSAIVGAIAIIVALVEHFWR